MDIQSRNKVIFTLFRSKTSRHEEFLRRQAVFDQKLNAEIDLDSDLLHQIDNPWMAAAMDFKYSFADAKRKPTAKSRSLKRKADYYAGVSDAAAAAALDVAERKVAPRRGAVGVLLNRRVGGLAGAELKAFDQAGDFDTIPVSPTGSEANTGNICCPVLGNAIDERLGNKITMKSIVIEFMLAPHYNENSSHQRGNLIVNTAVVMDKQTNSTAINGEDVYDATEDPHTRRVLENAARFRVLHFHRSVLTPVAVTGLPASNNVSTMWSADRWVFSMKLNQVVNFIQAAGGGTVADIKDHSISILCWGAEENGIVANALPTDLNLGWVSRVRFLD